MASPSMVGEVRRLSTALRQVARVLPAENPLMPPRGKKNAPSFLFEMKVLLALLSALKVDGWRIGIQKRSGRIHFVRAPASKATGSFFRLQRAGVEYHVTQGTEVFDRHGQPRAPDICLQVGTATEAPTYKDVLAIWDAKLRGTSLRHANKRISDNEFRGFAMVRGWLAPPLPGADVLVDWPPAFSVCALITNGLRPSEPDTVLIETHVSVVENFADATTPAWPSRADHISAHKLRKAFKR